MRGSTLRGWTSGDGAAAEAAAGHAGAVDALDLHRFFDQEIELGRADLVIVAQRVRGS